MITNFGTLGGTICTNNMEEEMAAMKGMLEWLIKESEEKEEEMVSFQSETSNEEVHSKKGCKLKNGGSQSLMTVEKIQDLIRNAVKIQLGGGARKTHLYTKPYTKRVDALYMPRGYQPLKF